MKLKKRLSAPERRQQLMEVARAVFAVSGYESASIEEIARQAGVTVYSGDNALYGDSLGPAESDGATYLASQLHNVRLILESWGVTPTAVPADLR